MKASKYDIISILGLLTILAMIFICRWAGSSDITDEFKLPPNLSEYKVVQLSSDCGRILYVLVKTNENREAIGASTLGKYSVHTIIIDGKEYVEKQ